MILRRACDAKLKSPAAARAKMLPGVFRLQRRSRLKIDFPRDIRGPRKTMVEVLAMTQLR